MKYVGMSVLKVPRPYVSSVKRKCTKCGGEVWIDENNVEIADSSEIVCDVCMFSGGS